MNRFARIPVLAAVTAVLLVNLSGCKRLEARNQLNKGVEAYKAAHYEEAINHFQKAVSLDPTYPMTRLYLATAYAQQVVPGLKTPQNEKTAQMAINGFNEVLKNHPHDVTAMEQIASLYYNLNELDKAKTWNEKVLHADPKNSQAAYTIGVIDWTKAFNNATSYLKASHLTEDGKGNPKLPRQYCEALKKKNTALVNEGMNYLQKSLDINPNYDDAMSYMNLMYRQKATLACGDAKQRKADVQTANDWAAKQLATRRANELKKSKGNEGIVIHSGE